MLGGEDRPVVALANDGLGAGDRDTETVVEGLGDAHPAGWSYNLVMSGATSGERVTVGVRELKNQLSSYLDRVKAGEEITVTEHGRAIARLTGLPPEEDRRAALIEAGIVRAAPATHRRLPSQRVKIAPGDPLEELVAQQRR
jgi:prevent-host-death family protein